MKPEWQREAAATTWAHISCPDTFPTLPCPNTVMAHITWLDTIREFQTQWLHYFSKSDNKSNRYHYHDRVLGDLRKEEDLLRQALLDEDLALNKGTLDFALLPYAIFFIYAYIQVCIDMYIYICVFIHTYSHSRIYIQVYMYVYLHANIYVQIKTIICMYMNVYMYMQTYIFAYINIYVYIYTCICSSKWIDQ